MVETASKKDTRGLKSKIAALHTFFLKNEDNETANKAKQLAEKLADQEFSIAFCGHFSAGKSSMINKLVGENLLPSSPIPTSANLVKVKSGEEYAKVFFKEGKPRLYLAPYNYEKVKTYAKDGDQIQSIEISHTTEHLPKGSCIMDTPGIDSTDDAHRIATESALHLADLVIYVMDYNHVQSELNFLFTKELTNAGKDVYLVINQIDKHRDEELSFDGFKNSVKDSFASWGVHPAQIFYTSLKVENHAHNDFLNLQRFVNEKWSERSELLPLSVEQSLMKLVDEHRNFLNERDHEEIEKLDGILSEVPTEEQNLISQNLESVNRELQEIANSINGREKALLDGVEEVLKSAYLMPFQTRDHASTYLQSRQPDFKVGLFFSKQKTEQERKLRLENFYNDFQEKVKSGLEWHLKELLLNTLKEDEIHDPNLLSKIQSFSVPITAQELENTVKLGARFSGDYVLTYTNDVSEVAKREAKKQVFSLKDSYLNLLDSKNDKKRQDLENEKKKFTNLYTAWNQKHQLLENQTAASIQMEQYISGHFDQEALHEDFDDLIRVREEVDIITDSELEVKVEKSKHQDRNVTETYEEKVVNEDPEKINRIVRKLNYSANMLSSIPGFKKITEELIGKAERLENRGFTVALFGAFSAGKSSFANSLIGEKLLPVSPNPTTAAINKIMPVDDEHKHGLVNVKLKDSFYLFEDVKRSLSVFDLKARDFDEAIEQIKKVLAGISDFDSHEKTHFAFLNAFHKGFETYRNQLGEVIVTDLTEFREFVANEEKSCLVESIEVYYDCELTRKGITLVDTPGADSINARHTGVAFEYIKNSDAILFVTYYNHAFSKADREFLIQLGRVKDTFELDKMFFIVNAVDLANNEEEKEDVMNYVNDQLVQYGIRRPSLFPISSLLAIQEKLEKRTDGASGIKNFEEQFYSFISHDLTDITIDSATKEWERAVELLKSYIGSAKQDNESKQTKMATLQNDQRRIEIFIHGQSTEFLEQRLNQEIDELTYYIKQRVFLRFSDFFKEAFNPSVLKDDGRNLKKALQHALDDFLADFGFDFAQELRATTLRIESFMGKILVDFQQTLKQELSEMSGELSFSQYEMGQIDALSFESAFVEIEKELFKKALSYFKNPKSFFENNEKRFMMETLEEVLGQPADLYLETENHKLKAYYHDHLNREKDSVIKLLNEEIEEYYEGMYATLRNEIPVEQLMELEKKLVTFS